VYVVIPADETFTQMIGFLVRTIAHIEQPSHFSHDQSSRWSQKRFDLIESSMAAPAFRNSGSLTT
jgi:hypothetical protein